MRGKVGDTLDGGMVAGITPAYAGKSRRTRLHHKAIWDHPRVCGEKTKKIP